MNISKTAVLSKLAGRRDEESEIARAFLLSEDTRALLEANNAMRVDEATRVWGTRLENASIPLRAVGAEPLLRRLETLDPMADLSFNHFVGPTMAGTVFFDGAGETLIGFVFVATTPNERNAR